MTGELIEQYVSILEKTNNQLSLWRNPYGVLITLLGVLFAIGAIVAAILLYRQSQDYKTQQKENMENQRKIFKEFLEKQEMDVLNNHKKIEKIGQEFEALITKYEEKIDNTTKKGEQDIKETLKELKKEKEKIMSQTYIPTIDATEVNSISNFDYNYPWRKSISNFDYSVLGDNKTELKICNNCNNKFYVNKKATIGASLSLGHKCICPFCGKESYL